MVKKQDANEMYKQNIAKLKEMKTKSSLKKSIVDTIVDYSLSKKKVIDE